LPIGEPHPALLVIDRAISSDQGLKYVYVVDSKDKVKYRRVTTGALQEDGLRVIDPWDPEKETGLKPDDWVVVGGLPQIRANAVVKREEVPMPFLTNNEPQTLAPKAKK
jgi:multidrug efflux system membrane fusion protein